jgi:hypothetical protein
MCQYCDQSINKIATQTSSSKRATHYYCLACQVYYHYVEPIAPEKENYLHKITLWNIQMPKGEFFVEIFPQEKRSIIYSVLIVFLLAGTSLDGARVSKKVFTLNCIPNWTPADVAQRLNNLLIWI